MPSLILFLGSKNTGPHINAMSYVVDKENIDAGRNTDKLVFVKILNPPIRIEDDFEEFFKKKLENDLSDLAESKYQGQPCYTPVNLYKKVRYYFVNRQHREEVNYQLLEEGMLEIRKSYGQDSIVDITGMPQRISLHLLLACNSAGFNKVMIFELKRQFTGIDALYHNLEEGQDYEYVNLSREAEKYKNTASPSSSISPAASTTSATNNTMSGQSPVFNSLSATKLSSSAIAVTISVCLNLIFLFEVAIYMSQWHWLINHPNSYGIQASFDLLLILLVTGFFLPKYRKWCWGAGAFAILLVLAQILGGPNK